MGRVAVVGYAAAMDPARKLHTYADLEALDEGVRAEIIGGNLETLPSPLPRHSRAQRSLSRQLGGPLDDDDGFGGPGGWWILLEVDVELSSHDIVQPDLSGWRRVRLPEPDVRPIRVIPDWVCEISSPSTAQRDRVVKSRLYAESGVPFYWLVDPDARTLEALELSNGRWLDVGRWTDLEIARVPPFEAVELDLRKLFLPKQATPT